MKSKSTSLTKRSISGVKVRDSLVRRFPNRPEAKHETIVALPLRLIALIQQHAPGFWCDEDVEFETTLRRQLGSGIWGKRPFLMEFVGHADEITAEQQQPRSGRRSKDAAANTRAKGLIPRTARTEFQVKLAHAFSLKMREHTKGYLGWLVTEPTFRRELNDHLQRHESWIQQEGRFPEIPQWFCGVQMGRGFSSNERNKFEETEGGFFLDRWGLETLLTPELPYPQQPQLDRMSLYDLTAMPGGLVLFLPWYLFHDQTISLTEVVKIRAAGRDLAHLKDWLQRSTDRWGFQRYATMFDLYVLWFLGLQARYGNRLHGFVKRLDDAFAVYLDPSRRDPLEIEKSAEVVRKIRHRMLRRLRSCEH